MSEAGVALKGIGQQGDDLKKLNEKRELFVAECKQKIAMLKAENGVKLAALDAEITGLKVKVYERRIKELEDELEAQKKI